MGIKTLPGSPAVQKISSDARQEMRTMLGFEPTTSTLPWWRSTPEPHQQVTVVTISLYLLYQIIPVLQIEKLICN